MTTATQSTSANASVTAVGLLTVLVGVAYLLTGAYLVVAGTAVVKDLEDDPAGGLGFLLQFIAGFLAVVGVVFLLQGVPGVLAGVGVLMRKTWGRILTMVFAAVAATWGLIFVVISRGDATMSLFGAAQLAYGVFVFVVLVWNDAQVARRA
jgi:hypothetical protein